MSLRTRMWVGFAVIAGVLVVAGLLVLSLQRNYLTESLDQRLLRQTANATSGSGQGLARGEGISEAYVGVLNSGELTTLSTPTTDPGLTPDLSGSVPEAGTPTTVPASGGVAGHMRVVTVETDGGTLVVGRSMADVEATVADLRTTLVVVGVVLLAVIALVFWWMRRLGLDPILRVTGVARAISAGDTSERVETFPAGTEAADLGAAFNQLVETNEATNARLRQFVADASHELRTPLVTLKGYAALHGSGGVSDPAATADAMRRIRQEANRMSRLVEDLLLLAQLDQGPGPDPSREPVELVAILEDLAEDLRVIDPTRTITVAHDGPGLVLGDRDRLTQVLGALTSNALRHTPPGTTIALRVRPHGSAVRVEVTDSGPGIAPADQQRVFDRFFRSDSARARSSGGTGLGLAIASAIVTDHGGIIGVDSTPGAGATFWVELPRAAT